MRQMRLGTCLKRLGARLIRPPTVLVLWESFKTLCNSFETTGDVFAAPWGGFAMPVERILDGFGRAGGAFYAFQTICSGLRTPVRTSLRRLERGLDVLGQPWPVF